MKDDLAEILFQSFLQEAIMSSSGVGGDVSSLMLSIQHFLCQLVVTFFGRLQGFWENDTHSFHTCIFFVSFFTWRLACAH